MILFISASVYYNYFFDYIWLSPTSEAFFGFPVYRYRQQDANLYGSELVGILKPASLKNWQWKEVFAFTNATLKDSGNLPFISPAKLTSSIRYETNLKGGINIFIEPEIVYSSAQNKPAQFETNTPSYTLVNFSSGVELLAAKGNWKLGLNINNITNKQYFDHLSRLKYLGLYNQGLNFILSVRKEIKW
ncbi:MAG: TonB-dependent receptor [Chitinophagia bacterium]|nr:TonB-dependent receptor [Chitinophagia bacterium]